MKSRRSVWGAPIIVMSCAVLLLTWGCSSYPTVTSPESQDFIKQVYTACNTKNSERLARCSERLAELTKDQMVTKDEAVAFERIINLAKTGDWSAAQQRTLDFAQRQVR